MSTLVKYNLVEESEKSWKLKEKTNYIDLLKTGDKILLTNIYQKYFYLKGNELIKHVYELYPYYAINSLMSKKILNKEKYKTVLENKPDKTGYAVFTIGYEGKSVEQFANELIKEDIKVLCDIRKNAFSMKYGFSKKQLKLIVENVGIIYVHIPELGIASNKREGLNSKENYEKLFKDYEDNILPDNKNALEELYNIFISNKRIALMCFEADYNYCHRSRTIKALKKINKKESLFKNL